MERAMELAQLGAGAVSPNPLVGCVIVHEGTIIGEGWHKKYGEAHAEVNAIDSVANHSLLAHSTLYVTLEPCSHFGKTPPCADLIVSKKIRRVVIANLDSNPLVAGNGIKKLRENGAEVLTGVLEQEGRHLNRRFFTFMEKKRPYIILKWAQTSDGFIARENYDSKWISNETSRQLVHKWRAEEDAVLVGTRTAKHDDPQLNVRNWSGRDPVRIVIDLNLTLPPSLKLFQGSQKTICYNLIKSEERENVVFVQLTSENFLSGLLSDLTRRNIQSVIIEGGLMTLENFISAGLWDEARVFTSPEKFEKGIAAPRVNGKMLDEITIGSDVLRIVVR